MRLARSIFHRRWLSTNHFSGYMLSSTVSAGICCNLIVSMSGFSRFSVAATPSRFEGLNGRFLSETAAGGHVTSMSDASAPEIREAYEDVRSDATDTNWLLIGYEQGSGCKRWALIGKGSGGLDELKSYIDQGSWASATSASSRATR
jgi:hypothetical protein